MELRNGGRISTAALSAGNAGSIEVVAGRLLIDRDGSFFTGFDSASYFGVGNSGSISVAAKDLEIRNGGGISTAALSAGDAGSVRVVAERLLIDGTGSNFFTGISSDVSGTSAGDAGNVLVAAPQLTLVAGSITSTSTGQGAGGTVEVTTAAGSAVAAAYAVQREPLTGSIVMSDGATIATSTAGPADAGQVMVRTGDLSLSDVDTRIASSTTGNGDAGTVRIEVWQNLTLDQARIESSSQGAGAGAGGDVTILARTADVTLRGSGAIAASAEGGRAAGDVVVRGRQPERQGWCYQYLGVKMRPADGSPSPPASGSICATPR